MTSSKLYDEIGAFTAMPNWAIEMGDQIGTDGLVLLMAFRYHSGVGGMIFPAYELLRKHTGLTNRRIALAIRKLEELKIVERQKRFGQSTIYSLKNLHTPTNSTPPPGELDSSLHAGDQFSTPCTTVLQHVETNKTHLTRIIKQESLSDEDYGAVFTAYQENIGVITSTILKDKITDAAETHGKEKVIKAIETAALNRARSWNYIEKVLQNNGNGYKPNILAGFRGPDE